MDVDDVNFEVGRKRLKEKKKQSNLFVYFDDECAVLFITCH